MPATKCGGCAKFLSPLDAAKCGQCSICYHRDCVNLPSKRSVMPTWRCPECNKNIIRDNKADTPVRGGINALSAEQQHSNTSPVNNSPTLLTTTHISSDVADELRLFKEELRTEFRLMHQEFEQLRTEMADMKQALKTSTTRMDDLESRVSALEHKLGQEFPFDDNRGKVESTIAELKSQLNERDQDLLLNDVEISCIPEIKEESILHIVRVVAVKLGLELDERDIIHAERVGSTHRNQVENADGSISAHPVIQRPRNIAVRFARRTARNALLHAARVRRSLTSADVLNTATGPSRRVYVNERLTRTKRQLFYRTRQAGGQQNWKYLWTKDGKIFARKEDRQKVQRIRSEDDINRIFG